ncbi:hypothetical protein [Halorientalis marina]|uniref:hypothetical protein n=1 Tax=Halorientalis marina TaxID=2931976 RepID=UPI001FF4A464|nr:hypothetical protein [Halorientalis marina]
MPRPAWISTAILALLLAASGASVGQGGSTPPASATIEPVDSGDRLWPYTSRSQSVAGRTLAINVIVDASPDRVVRVLTRRTDTDWEPADVTADATDDANATEVSDTTGTSGENATGERTTLTPGSGNATADGTTSNGENVTAEGNVTVDGNVSDEGNVTVPLLGVEGIEIETEGDDLSVSASGFEVVWRSTHGATRYTYVRPGATGGRWVTETAQIHDGSYLGTRRHIRLYGPPSGGWTALQAHGEWWDWFRLRHTVTGVATAQASLERDLAGEPVVDGIERDHPAHGGQNSQGITRIAVAAALVLVIGTRRRVTALVGTLTAKRRRALLLAVGVAGVSLGIRVAGVAIEGFLPWLHPKVIAALLYPVLAAGTPILAHWLGGGLDPRVAGIVAGGSLVGVTLLDGLVVGIGIPPAGLLQHRVGLGIALGIVAAAGAREAAIRDRRTLDGRDRWLLALGVACWLLALAVPLFGL